MAVTSRGTYVYDKRVGRTVFVEGGTSSTTLTDDMLRQMRNPDLWAATPPAETESHNEDAVVSATIDRVEFLTRTQFNALATPRNPRTAYYVREG